MQIAADVEVYRDRRWTDIAHRLGQDGLRGRGAEPVTTDVPALRLFVLSNFKFYCERRQHADRAARASEDGLMR